jgi:hypothetical protein
MGDKSILVVISLIVCVGLCVPSMGASTPTVDLTTTTQGTINDALYEVFTGTHGAGSGHFPAFLVIQNDGIEEGYNTDGTVLPDVKPAHTKSLSLSSVPRVQVDGEYYREFLLDGHDSTSGDDKYLSLDQLMIALHTSRTLDGAVDDVFASPTYSMDTPASATHGFIDNWVKVDTSLSSGGGQADVTVLIPDDLFDTSLGEWVYLYSKMGVNFGADATPEEWACAGTDVTVPAPAAILLAGLGTLIAVSLRRRPTSRS